MNLPVIMISSNDKNINSRYLWLKGNVVRPILELVENLFYDRIKNSGEVKRLNEEIKQVELPDEGKLLWEEVEHDELPDEEKLPAEKRLEEEVEHAELPDEENKKKLGREKAGEHHQRMVWTGDRERIFAKIVTELDKNGKATGKKVWERMQDNGFKDISIKQVNSHLQKHRGKPKKVHPVDNSYRMLEHKDQVDTSQGQDASRHGMEEHSSKTDAPINGNLNTTSQEQRLIPELLNNNIPGNFENPNGFSSWAEFFQQSSESSQGPIEATSLYTMEGQPSNLLVSNIPGQALDKNVFDLPSKEGEEVYIPGPNLDDLQFEDIDSQQHSINMGDDFLELMDPDFMNLNS